MTADTGGFTWIPRNFLALEPHQSNLETARAVLIPVPYDSAASFRSGARDGPGAIIEASYGLEDYDHELDSDVSELGIHTTAALEPHLGGAGGDGAAGAGRRWRATSRRGRVVGVLGGDHSISAGAALAHAEAFPGLSALYLDAHADMRDSYLGASWSHASGGAANPRSLPRRAGRHTQLVPRGAGFSPGKIPSRPFSGPRRAAARRGCRTKSRRR